MKIFEAQVRISNDLDTTIIKIRVMAGTTFQARLLLEQQYGRENILDSLRQII